MVKIAFVLAGCGFRDGSEIHEATCALLVADQQGCQYRCFALDREQYCVTNHLTGEVMQEKRNVLVEAARIARGNIANIQELRAQDYDVVFFVGGNGAAQNNFSYAYEGEDYRVDAEISRVAQEFYQTHKPICAVCIAPLILAKTLTGVDLTLGTDAKVAQLVEANGNHFVNTNSGEICVDRVHRIITAPCYMLAKSIKTIYQEVEQMFTAALSLL